MTCSFFAIEIAIIMTLLRTYYTCTHTHTLTHTHRNERHVNEKSDYQYYWFFLGYSY